MVEESVERERRGIGGEAKGSRRFSKILMQTRILVEQLCAENA